jgi:hypothetical protein
VAGRRGVGAAAGGDRRGGLRHRHRGGPTPRYGLCPPARLGPRRRRAAAGRAVRRECTVDPGARRRGGPRRGDRGRRPAGRGRAAVGGVPAGRPGRHPHHRPGGRPAAAGARP